MRPFLQGFTDELIKLGRAASPAEQQSREQAQALMPKQPSVPMPKPAASSGGPTGPILRQRPSETPSMPATKAPPKLQPIDPYGPGYKPKEDKRFGFVQRKTTAPASVSQELGRPSNAAGPTPDALKAIGRQTMHFDGRSPKPLLTRSSPTYIPKAAPPKEEPKPEKRGGRGRSKDYGPDTNLRRKPWETGGEFLKRRAKEQENWKAEQERIRGERFEANPQMKQRSKAIAGGSAARAGGFTFSPNEYPRGATSKQRAEWDAQQEYNRRRLQTQAKDREIESIEEAHARIKKEGARVRAERARKKYNSELRAGKHRNLRGILND